MLHKITKQQAIALKAAGYNVTEDFSRAASGVIIDYKTTSATSAPTKFKREYYFQLMTYAWIYREMGRPVDRLRLVYVTRGDMNRISEKTGKRLKDYPPTVTTVDHLITPADFDLIEGCIKCVAHSVQLWNSHPEYRFALAQDWRLYKKPPPRLFIKD